MRMTKEESREVALRILGNKFGIYGYGNFDLSVDEFAKLLVIAINSDYENVDSNLSEYYRSIK